MGMCGVMPAMPTRPRSTIRSLKPRPKKYPLIPRLRIHRLQIHRPQIRPRLIRHLQIHHRLILRQKIRRQQTVHKHPSRQTPKSVCLFFVVCF